MIDRRDITRFKRDETGATLVEFAMVLPIFLLLFFGLIDFGRIGFSYVMAGKATERAVRLAVVQPPLCADVPEANLRGSNSSSGFGFGASCSLQAGICETAETRSCTLNTSTSAGSALWEQISALMPNNATADNLRISYEFSEDIGFLGGPYSPIVTVEIEDLEFEFVTPLGALIVLAGGTNASGAGTDYAFPSMSASLPAEALFDGDPT